MMSDPKETIPIEGEKEATAKVEETKSVSKEEYSKLSDSHKELETKLDEAKLSLLDPEYITFLESKRGKSDKVVEKVADTISDEEIDNLSSKQILKLAVSRAKDEIAKELLPKYDEALKKRDSTIADILAVLELQRVEKKYTDFDTYRADVHKVLSTSKTPLTIEQAYELAKSRRPAEPGEEKTGEKVEEKKSTATEKPNATIPAEAVERKDRKDKNAAANDAWDEIVGAGKDTL